MVEVTTGEWQRETSIGAWYLYVTRYDLRTRPPVKRRLVVGVVADSWMDTPGDRWYWFMPDAAFETISDEARAKVRKAVAISGYEQSLSDGMARVHNVRNHIRSYEIEEALAKVEHGAKLGYWLAGVTLTIIFIILLQLLFT